MEEQKKMWFAPKVYGRGVVPISREGWLITGFIVMLVVIGAPLIMGNTDTPATRDIILFFLFIFLVSLVPIFLLTSRMKGSLKWRWGKKDIDRE